MKIPFQFLILLLVAQSSVWGQSSITGVVKDSISNVPIEQAEVFLLQKESSKPLFHVRANAGRFVLKQVPEGVFYLVTTAPGHENDTLQFSIKNGDTLQLSIFLRLSANDLDAVIVKTTPRPLSIRGDTVVFNADAYAVRPYAQLEDLLRRLPGIEVDKEGNFTMQGQKIDKITIDGKDFFLDDPKQANNIPTEIIASIEAYSSQSDRAKFSGIKEPSTTKTLNIKTKKKMDKAIFGNAYASKGQGDSYATGAAISRLGGDRMLKGDFRLNNINNRFLGTDEKNTGSQNGIQSTANINITIREKWANKLAATFMFNKSSQTLDLLQTTSRRSFFNDSSIQENQLGQGRNKTTNYPAQMMLTYDLDSMNQLQLTSNFSISENTSSNQDTASTQTIFNDGESYVSGHSTTNNQIRQRAFNSSNQFEWRHRFSKVGRTMQLSFLHAAQNNKNPGSLYSLLNSFDGSGVLQQQAVVDQQYYQKTNGNTLSASITYTEPVAKGQSISLYYFILSQSQQKDKRSFDFDSLSGAYNKPNTATTNYFRNRNTTHQIEGSYLIRKKRAYYALSLVWQHNALDNTNITFDRRIRQQFTNVAPRLMMDFTLDKGKNITVSYNRTSSAPTTDQLQPLLDLSNPLLISTGNPDLKQTFNHTVNINLNAYNQKTFRGTMLSLVGDVVQNQIVSSVTLKPGGVQEQQYINVNGACHLGLMGYYSFRLGQGKNKNTQNSGSTTSWVRYGRDPGMVNSRENIASSLSWKQTFKLNYSIAKKFISELSSGVEYVAYRYSVIQGQNTNSWSQNATINASYEFPLGINIQSSYSWLHQGTSGLLPSQSVATLNAAIFKRLFQNQRWLIRLSCFDLFNSNRNFTQSAMSNYIYTRQTNQLQRMFLLSLVYDFRGFLNFGKSMDAMGAGSQVQVPRNR